MARYAYDVNTTQRYIDVHKQFQGGLKTVDTDDALGAVFLREAENVSISEFGFLEKRYGTFENFKETFSGNLQGYWEFEGYKIFAVDGDIFVNNINNRVVEFLEEPGLRYPTNDNIPFNVQPVFTTTTTCAFSDSGVPFESPTDVSTTTTCATGATRTVCTAPLDIGDPYICVEQTGLVTTTTTQTGVTIIDHFQAERDMNAVNINRVLYIFTGTYPVYAKVVEGELKFYLFPITVPTFDEIAVVGHNLLEDDYEGLYFPETFEDLTAPAASAQTQGLFEITETDFYPKIPFVEPDGTLNLKMSYRYKSLDTFAYTNPISAGGTTVYDEYFQLRLDRVGFRNSGAGASDLDFSLFNEDAIVKSNNLHNLATGQQTPSVFSEGFLIDKKVLVTSEFERSFGGSAETLHARYKVTTKDRFPKEAIHPNDVFTFQFFKRTNNANSPWEKLLFSSLHSNPNNYSSTLFPNDFTISIVPYDIDGALFEIGAVTINSSAVQTSNLDYVFTIPSGLSTSEFVNGYEVRFVHTFVSDSNFILEASEFSRTFSKSVAAENFSRFADNQFLTLNLSNLVSGLFDIQPVYILSKYIWDGSSLIFQSEQEIKTIFSNVRITPEKLQDYPGAIEYPTLKPIWTCNKVIEHFSKLMVWGSTEMPTAVFYSFPDRPTYFPSKFFLDFTNDQNSPVEAVSSYMNILVVQTRDQTWGIRGNSGLLTAPAPYAPFTINPTVGTIAYKSVRAVRNHLFFLSKQGIIALKSLYAADEQYNIEFVDRNILNIVPRDDDKAVGIQFDNQYWLNFPEERITLRWYIDKKAWVKDTYSAWQEFNGVFKYQIVDGKLEFITYPSLFDGENLGVYKIGVDYSLPTDLGGDVVALFETAFLNQNYPFHPKNYKETKMDFTVQNEYNLGRDPIYTMETNEDIDNNLHTIQSPALLKNHRYKLTYSENFEVTSVKLHETPLDFVKVEGVITFLLPNDAPVGSDLTVQGSFENYEGGASLLDITYDHILDFKTWIISEDKTLNLENFQGYDQSKADIPIELGARFGDWVFGLSDLGNKVTAIKTIKLAGRGYNVKVYFEDYSKSKWTLESLGITYKMKRPRSR
jgi:hypothetical protein